MRKLNSFLRMLFLVCGGLFVLIGLLPKAKRIQSDKEGFDNEEFDDIW